MRTLLILGAITIFGLINFQAHRFVNIRDLTEPQYKDVVHLVSGSKVKLLSLGFAPLLADFYLIKTQVFIHDHQNDPDAREILKGLFDIILELDPQYTDAYYLAYHSLSKFYGLFGVSDANEILMKGLKYNPRDCNLMRYIGVNFYQYSEDPAMAAKYLKTAIAMGCKENLIWMADEANKEKGQDECVRANIFCSEMDEFKEKRMDESFIEMVHKRCVGLQAFCLIRKGINLYEKETGECPRGGDGFARLDELLRKVDMGGPIPQDLFGGKYYIDDDCKPASTSNLRPMEEKK